MKAQISAQCAKKLGTVYCFVLCKKNFTFMLMILSWIPIINEKQLKTAFRFWLEVLNSFGTLLG